LSFSVIRSPALKGEDGRHYRENEMGECQKYFGKGKYINVATKEFEGQREGRMRGERKWRDACSVDGNKEKVSKKNQCVEDRTRCQSAGMEKKEETRRKYCTIGSMDEGK